MSEGDFEVVEPGERSRIDQTRVILNRVLDECAKGRLDLDKDNYLVELPAELLAQVRELVKDSSHDAAPA